MHKAAYNFVFLRLVYSSGFQPGVVNHSLRGRE